MDSSGIKKGVKIMNDMKEKLFSILEDIRPDVDFSSEQKLIDDEILDSFDIVSLVGELDEAFGIEINVDDLMPENFDSPEAILQLVNKLMEE